jgi:hypothetical protein
MEESAVAAAPPPTLTTGLSSRTHNLSACAIPLSSAVADGNVLCACCVVVLLCRAAEWSLQLRAMSVRCAWVGSAIGGTVGHTKVWFKAPAGAQKRLRGSFGRRYGPVLLHHPHPPKGRSRVAAGTCLPHFRVHVHRTGQDLFYAVSACCVPLVAQPETSDAGVGGRRHASTDECRHSFIVWHARTVRGAPPVPQFSIFVSSSRS